jgi:hypothetical protein
MRNVPAGTLTIASRDFTSSTCSVCSAELPVIDKAASAIKKKIRRNGDISPSLDAADSTADK